MRRPRPVMRLPGPHPAGQCPTGGCDDCIIPEGRPHAGQTRRQVKAMTDPSKWDDLFGDEP